MKYFWRGLAVLMFSSLLICWMACFGLSGRSSAFPALVAGNLLACAYVAAGFITCYLSRSRKESSFQKIFSAGIFGRLAVMMAVIVLILKYADLEYLPFIISLIGCYFIFQIWEILSLNRLAAGEQ